MTRGKSFSASLGTGLVTGAVALIVLLSTAGCSSNAETKTQGPPPPVVQVITVQPQDAEVFVEYPAQTYARNLVEVRGRVDGYIERWLFKPGQQVKAGQPLYVLDLRPYRAQLQQAQGTVRQAEADLSFARQQTSLLQAEANLATAKSNLVKAQQDYERFKPLVEQDAAARQELDAATAALRAAESAVRANEAAVEQAKVNTNTQIDAAEGKLVTQKGALQTANLNLQYGTITAPISGLIGDSLTPVGGLVNANSAQPLTTIAPLDPIWVRFKVSESQYLKYKRLESGSGKEGRSLQLLLADGTPFQNRGTIENTLNQVDARTGTLELQARFPNQQGTLLPGQFGRIRFVSEHKQNALLIPQRAVQQSQSLQSVFVVTRDNRIEARPVQTGDRIGEEWIIERGLKAGDRVVVEGLLSVRPGAPVRPTPFKPDQPAQSAGQ